MKKTFHYHQELFQKVDETIKNNHEFLNKGIDLENFFLDLFDNSFSCNEHKYLLYYINSLRKSFSISGFLFMGRQTYSGGHSLRNMIETGEILISYILAPKKVIAIVNRTDMKSQGDEVRKISYTYLKNINDTNLITLSNSMRDWKDLLNSLSHSHPNLNLTSLSGIENETLFASVFDSDTQIDWKNNYLMALKIYEDLIHIIFIVTKNSEFDIYLNYKGEFPDFGIEKLDINYIS